ncbi:MAG: ABC transporter permease [Propionibacteriaceae bacterium]|jgi:putative ABC transport system permease protein|nr:ABC transporter permease [Propionibacteriaceae bacterium]
MAADAKRARRAMFTTMIVRALSRRRSRMLVALLAVTVGATMLTGLSAVVLGAPSQMGRELRSYGANLVVSGNISTSSLPSLDAAVASDDVVGRAPYRYAELKLNEQAVTAAGTDMESVQSVRPYWQVSGSYPTSGQVLLGRDLAATFGLKTGETISLAKVGADEAAAMTVAGILDTGGSEDSFVVLPLEDLDKLLGEEGKLDVVEYSIATSNLDAAAAKLAQAVPGASADPVKRLAKSENTVLNTLSSLLGIVAVVVLTLMLITVATTMLAVVTERRSEIGLKKAIGASHRELLREFLGEGVLLGIAGGVVGGILGLGFSQLVAMQVFARPIDVVWGLLPASILISAAVTVVASLWPVGRVLATDPAIVLREE